MSIARIVVQLRRRLRCVAAALRPGSKLGPRLGSPPICGSGPQNAANWDQYWTDRLRAPAKFIRHYQCDPTGMLWIRDLVEKLRDRHAFRLLFVGNGIS